MVYAVGTATALVVPVSLIELVVLFSTGINHHLANSIGYIYMPAFIPITVFGLFFSKLGVYMGRKFSEKRVRFLVGAVMIAVSVKLLWI